ncbi:MULTISPECIES: hypothetical protein [unclassified Streptomyces]|uniref:hypothetical protein n=1 Tax=unclassified Streptomyces TaxID=2593676 RepID=UPI002E0E15C4|nr:MULTISPECIES: hypothetical protein [unclassified Streptomyces]WSR22868.1 hypothetical protein OG573_29565 [Streptomyces sp. NBC_01205]
MHDDESITDRTEGAQRPGESDLSTRDLADPGRSEGAAVYPGEATAGADGGPGTAQEDAGQAAQDGSTDGRGEDEPLLDGKEAEEYRTAWREIQGRFVDDPQDAVRSADTLVAEVMQTLARSFSDHKQTLVDQWGRGEQVPTEDLRLALQRYRSFFNRLLNT